MNNKSYITFPVFSKYPELICVFSTRIGGFSRNEYATMNMGLTSGDDLDNVRKNRKHFFDLLQIDENKLAIPKQIHSASVKNVNNPGVFSDTDALCTDEPGLFLSVQTADCLPIFVYEPDKKVIAVIHAGWQGAIKGIIDKTLKKMTESYKINMDNLKVAIGPGIQDSCFELREDVHSQFPDAFLKVHPEVEKKYLDLPAFAKDQLIKKGVVDTNIYTDLSCTHCDSDRFYSYRRDHEKSGRMIGIIGLIEK